MNHDKCAINSTEINFLREATNSSIQSLKRWLKFCKTVYVDGCDLYSLSPPLTSIHKMLERSTHDDCFSNKNMAIYCISMILSVAIILTNAVVITSFVRYRNLLTSSNLPILSLALSDILTGISFMYSTTWNLILLTASYKFDIERSQYYALKRSNYYLCLTFDGSGVLFTCMMSSVLTLGIIATQRYIALFHPYRFQSWLTIPNIIIAIVSTWIISIVVGILPLSGWNNWSGNCQLSEVLDFSYIILWSTICFVSGIIMLFVYIRIFVLTKKHIRQIQSTRITSTSSCSLHSSAERTNTVKRQMQDAEAAQETTSTISRQQISSEMKNENAVHESASTLHLNTNSCVINVLPTNPGDGGVTFSSPSPTSLKYETKDKRSSLSEQRESINEPDHTPHRQKDESPRRMTSRRQNREKKHRQSSISSDGRRSSHRGSRQFIKPPSRTAVTTAMILGAFYICWTPLLVYLLVFHKNNNNLLTYYLAVVTQINSVFNPITYGLRNSDIKAAIKKLFHCDGQ